jgi:hypothetical protein
MSIYSSYATDPTLESEGVWVQLREDMEVKVAAFTSKEFTALLERLKLPHKALIRKGGLDAKVEEDLYTQAMAKAIIVDWRGKGWVDEAGKPAAYSPEQAYKYLTDEKLKHFKADIIFLAKEQETYRLQEKEESTKNSKKSSAGS